MKQAEVVSKMGLEASNAQLNGDFHEQVSGSSSEPRFLIIGAGSRGNAYARAVTKSTNGSIVAVAEPVAFKRDSMGRKYIWVNEEPVEGQAFDNWTAFVTYEQIRRKRKAEGVSVPPGVDGVFICVLDELHAEIILGLRDLNLHIMCEKPLATTLEDCLMIYRALQPPENESQQKIFSIGHVLHYSPHNMLLRKLLLEARVIGDILSIEHTEPVGWWHFAHSYVRGNWRKESTTAPSLLTKSCHDIDLLLWLLCSPPSSSPRGPPHLPCYVSSTGSLKYFKQSRKPAAAGKATNCLSCPAEPECIYSAKKIYQDGHLSKGNTGWPVEIVDPEIENCLAQQGQAAAQSKLRKRLAEDYEVSTPQQEIDSRPWFGRCVYESDNDVCDDQVVTITWEDDPLPQSSHGTDSTNSRLKGRGAKTATFHMIAFTEAQCERRGRVYGSEGEISYNDKEIRVYDFATKKAETYQPPRRGGGHGGGDDGLTQQYVKAVEAAIKGFNVAEAQVEYVGCTLEEVIRSHAMVFAAEEARRERKVVDWRAWWQSNVPTTS